MAASPRFLFAFLLLALAASTAQSPAPASGDLNRRIEANFRAHFRVAQRVNVAIGPRHPSEFAGYDAVAITLSDPQHSTPYEFLLSKDGNTLVQFNHIDVSRDPFSVDGRPMRGARDAKVTIIVYDDFQCPYCAKGHQTLFTEIFPQYKDKIRVVYKDFPLAEIHPWAVHAAVDANCLFDQSSDAYWDFADYVHGNQQDIRGENRPLDAQLSTLDHSALGYGKKYNVDMPRLEACVKAQDEKAVRASLKYGEDTLGIDSTPTLFVNGEKLEGAVPGDDLRKVLDSALRDAGVPPPVNAAKINVTNSAEAVKNATKGLNLGSAQPADVAPKSPAPNLPAKPEAPKR